MAYNSSKGPQTHGDVKFEGDAEDTQIDFETDLVALKTNGIQRFIVSGSAITSSVPISSSAAISASAFFADGVAVGAAAISSYTNASNNRILTSVDSNTVNAEANLTFDSTSKFLFLSGNVQVRNHIPSMFFSNSAGTGLALLGVNSSDNFVFQNNTTNKHIVFKTNDAGSMKEGLRINGAVPEVVVNESSDSLIDFRVESNANTHMLYVDGNANRVGVNTTAPSHTFAVSGSASVSGSFMVTGSMRAKALHMTHHNFAHGGTADVWIPWNSLIENTTDGEEHMMVTPFSGRLVKIMFRPEDNQNGNVTMNLYRALDGTKLIRNGALVEAITVSMGSADATTATFATSGSDHFGAGDAVGIKLDVNAAPGDCQLTCVWEFNQS
jgi:hypothetical protein